MKLLLFSLLIVASFASCKKDPNQLPEPSSSGKNFLACKVNGVVHKYTVEDALGRNGVGYSRYIDGLTIGAAEADYKDDLGITVFLSPDSVRREVTYELGGETSIGIGHYIIFQTGGGPVLEYTTTVGSGWVRFSRVDTAVAAGTFALTAYIDGQQGKDSVVFTEGVFDIAR
jgi:hypothetical protein